ncbi:SigE family RNA polymerase sigma factor [Pseudofrankia inefficax]|uniref:RNA polymerase, sigma-24 subunit, ECF subfamily n=1 Tax=Pseudofrankia inefficax (strain DSM 45817 / CECT 9037 / DDB 130130 / EuI1c) TaxID=298654 RepID=E3JBP8_PSEI1|nr:SigE family RNA polymerase sigma factor [Pseudofrankia inefficax]ADP81068.1 RNA polymerase, sigma-24 subunit, ECF subfamily [Pseudofrankia inefficax]
MTSHRSGDPFAAPEATAHRVRRSGPAGPPPPSGVDEISTGAPPGGVGGDGADPSVPASFEAFVRTRSDALFRTAFVMTGQRAAAEDLVQESLARMLPVWKRVSERGSPDAYVYRVMTNLHRSTWRRVLRRERPTFPLPDAPGPDGIARWERLHQLSRALAELSPRQRSAVVLRHYLQLSEAETAAVLGCRVGTVKSLTSRGLAQLRSSYHAEEGLHG